MAKRNQSTDLSKRAQQRFKDLPYGEGTPEMERNYRIEGRSIVRRDRRVEFTKKQRRWMKRQRELGYTEYEIREMLLGGGGPALTREQVKMLNANRPKSKPEPKLSRAQRKRLLK